MTHDCFKSWIFNKAHWWFWVVRSFFVCFFFLRKEKNKTNKKTKSPLLPASLCRSLSLWSITVIHWDCFLSAAWLQGHEKHSRSGGAESGKISQLKCNGGQYFRALLLFCVERCSCLCVTGSNFHTTQRCSPVGVFFFFLSLDTEYLAKITRRLWTFPQFVMLQPETLV